MPGPHRCPGFELAERVGRRPVGNIRQLLGGGYRLRFARDGEMRTSPEVFRTRAAAERAPWKMANEGRADCHHDCTFTISATPGNTFPASGSAGLKDLMARMGHDSERAALIYQHEARGADQRITGAIDAHVHAERGKGDDEDGAAGPRSRRANCTLVARRPDKAQR